MSQSSQPKPTAIIFQTSDIDSKIYVREQKGLFQKRRRLLAWSLMLVFIFLPFVQYEGGQGILFDVEAQRLRVFGANFYPQDLMLFVFLFVFFAFLLFYISARYGRVWCGFTCPQTIWTLLFMWVENRIEGNTQQRRQLDKASWSANKLGKKLFKHTSWGLISTLTALVFMSYFVPANELYSQFASGSLSATVTAWVTFFSICTYFNAGLVREKMCQHMCPYARFQSVMMSEQTKLISYDTKRGENRGPRKLKGPAPAGLGHCVDCKLCVQVCPVGIDIRDGLQYDCINCGLCIDACDQTMNKFGYPPGLIRFASLASQETKSMKRLGYIPLMILTLVVSLLWLQHRPVFEMNVFKDRNLLYRSNDDGQIENSYQLEILNKTNRDQAIEIGLVTGPGFIFNPPTELVLSANERRSLIVTVTDKAGTRARFQPIEFSLIAQGQVALTHTSTFHSP